MATSSPLLRRAAPFFLLFAFTFCTVSQAATLTVRKDGTGQFTTINAAKAAAVTGDIIDVGPGVYPEEVDFSIAVTLRSTDGAAATILDGENTRRLLIFRAGFGSVVDGFTLRRGIQASAAGALRVQLGATASVRNCVFEDNHADYDGGAVICRDPGSRLDLTDCTFRHNIAERFGGAIKLIDEAEAVIERCVFTDNRGADNGGITADLEAVFSVRDCLFVANTGTKGAIWAEGGSWPTITGNTFYANTGTTSLQFSHCSFVLERNLFVGNPQGGALGSSGAVAISRSCNLFWNNRLADQLVDSEILADPLFCDAANGVFTIDETSPAAPLHSPCAALMGAFPVDCDATPPGTIEPRILSILDVPNDQGNQVRIRWERCEYDALGQPFVITGYGVYRYQGAFLAGTKLPAGPRMVSAQSPAIDGWDYIATVPARGDAIYQFVAPTLCNKPVGGDPCYSTFFVSAMTPNPLVYFDSFPDSGYSEDNLPPGAPPAFAVSISSGGAELVWDAPRDADLDHYRIYRLKGRAYPLPIGHNLVHSTTAQTWLDPAGTAQTHYVMTAVDVNGNESDPIEPDVGINDDGAPIPVEFSMGQNSPNPFNPVTAIRYDVPAGGGHVTIEVFDVAGRRVRSLVDEHRAAGTWTVMWDGRSDRGVSVASGIYFCRLRAPGYSRTMRMTLIE